MSLLLQQQRAVQHDLAAGRGTGARPGRPRSLACSSPALRILEDSQRLNILAHADEELMNFCAARQSPEEQARCLEVWQYYHDSRSQAQNGCIRELEAGSPANSCAKLDTLEKLVYEVAFAGDAEQLYHVLRTQANMAKRAAAGAAEPSGADRRDSERAKALELFDKIDADGNGVIDREEFLSAMATLQHVLSDAELGDVFSCMDSHGYITSEQFVSILQAEQLCDPDCDAEVLRHVPHAKPAWWSDAPACVMDV